jgi:3',5'-cyclic AMP phosphodiesterase CpdA
MMRAAAAINAQKPDIVIAGGDLITDGFECSAETAEPRWDAYMAMHDAIEAPVYTVIGNNDLVGVEPEDGSPPADDPRSVFREKFGMEQLYYSFDVRGYHFIVLDGTMLTDATDLGYEGRVWPEQIEWIKQDLAAVSADTPIVLATHFPLLTVLYEAAAKMSAVPLRRRRIQNNEEVLALFEDHNLLIVLQGHMHVDEVIKWRGTTFITCGAVSGQWWRGPYYGTEEGFGIVRLNGDRVEWEYIEYPWEARRPKDK